MTEQCIKTIAINSISNSSQDQLAGWTASLLLAHRLKSTAIKIMHFCALGETQGNNLITLNGTVYLSQQQLDFLDELGISEKQLFIECNACNSLGRLYKDWSEKGQQYAFVEGEYGVNFNNIEFQHYLTLLKEDIYSSRFDQYSLAAVMANDDKFVHPVADERSILSSYSYGVNVDAQQYTQLIREKALNLGVKESCGDHLISAESKMENADVDFYFDCVKPLDKKEKCGLHTAQINKINSPINRVLTVDFPLAPSLKTADIFQAYAFGYTKQTQLKHKRVLQCFYHQNISEEEIVNQLASEGVLVDLAKSQTENFEQYQMEKPWQNNRLYIGHGSIKSDPLAGNILDFIHHDISLWLNNFPRKNNVSALARYYNETHSAFYAHIFDFISVHYQLSQWRSEQFWQSDLHQGSTCLKHLMELFQQTGVVMQSEHQYFTQKQWRNLFIGFNWLASNHDQLIDTSNHQGLINKIDTLRNQISQFSDKLPTYSSYLENQGL